MISVRDKFEKEYSTKYCHFLAAAQMRK